MGKFSDYLVQVALCGVLLVVACSKGDKSTNPFLFSKYHGITQTDETGKVFSVDPADWCDIPPSVGNTIQVTPDSISFTATNVGQVFERQIVIKNLVNQSISVSCSTTDTSFVLNSSTIIVPSLSADTVNCHYEQLDSTCRTGVAQFSVTSPLDRTIVRLDGRLVSDTSGGGVDDVTDGDLPVYYVLRPAYPNPTEIFSILEFDIPKKTLVKLWVSDGYQYSVELVNTMVAPGRKSVSWDCSKVPRGIYRAFISTPDWSCFGDIEVK